ncbi:AAA family ATPase [Agarilytica rhodophyticola]|uniref:AAA family ATPase n=1 Tax=Agarilytica rhodophyticola TaxID=1737490 RepID=UPI000B34962C|nr:AAA family ATPase [Agarilytica rhodophyticola]
MSQVIKEIIDGVGTVLLGKEQHVKLALACLFAKGHLLIEDLPGMGKTTLAQCLARALGLSYERVQFTSDLLPADILGAAIFNREASRFEFQPGPIFTQVLLADEVNRSTPKTQSALLEAMEERQVTIEGETRPLPQPFFVIATQNPLSQAGTYPLPESQLDRFLMRISLGYPSAQTERQLYQGVVPRERLQQLEPIISIEQLSEIQQHVKQIKASEQLLDYLQRIVDFTRFHESFSYGLSPRGALGLLQAAKAWALIHDREYVLPEDLQMVVPSVVGHRVSGVQNQTKNEVTSVGDTVAEFILKNVNVIESN